MSPTDSVETKAWAGWIRRNDTLGHKRRQSFVNRSLFDIQLTSAVLSQM